MEKWKHNVSMADDRNELDVMKAALLAVVEKQLDKHALTESPQAA